MSADQQILREYLVALGFRVDQSGNRKIDGLLNGLDKKAARLGKTMLGVGAAAIAMTHTFARQMERLYYASRYAESSAGNIQALEFGFKNIGLQGGKATEALKSMTQSIRSNPGLLGLLHSLGVKVEGRDKSDVLIDLVGALKTMPSYIAERYASLFGIDPETLFHLQQGLDKLKETRDARKQMASEMGVDSEKAAAVAVEYIRIWTEVKERATLFRDALAIELLPTVRELATVTNEVLKDWVQVVREINSAGTTSFWQRLAEGSTGRALGDRVTLSEDAKRRLGAPVVDETPTTKGSYWEHWNKFFRGARPRLYADRVAQDPKAVDATQDRSVFDDRNPGMSEAERVHRVNEALRGRAATPAPSPSPAPSGGGKAGSSDRQAYLRSLEEKYLLPEGLLDRIWAKESSRATGEKPVYGPVTKTGQRAEGPFQFMPPTAKDYGLKNPQDFHESADAAARKMRDLLNKYDGSLKKAAAAYNWGQGNLDQYGLGKAPAETRDYVNSVAGGSVTVNQDTNIHVHGVTDPKEAAGKVAEKQRTVNADIVRNFSPKVR